MRYRKLGRTGVEVSVQCLGTIMFGSWGNSDHRSCASMIGSALDAGINFIDTADVYGQGESEEIIGAALGARRDDVVLATKFVNQMGEGRNRRGGSRRWITRAVDDSLRRLRTDRIDLYQMHRYDWTTDVDETLGALTDLVRQGKVLHLGSSTFPADWIVEAQWAAARRNLDRFVCEQPQYSLFARSAEESVLPACQRHEMAVIPWSPLAGGWLTGKYRRDAPVPAGARFSGGAGPAYGRPVSGDRNAGVRFDLVERLSGVAAAAGLSTIQLALGFVDAHPAVTSTIIGPKSPDQLVALLGAADVVLDGSTLDAIDEIVRPARDVAGVSHLSGNPVPNEPALRRR